MKLLAGAAALLALGAGLGTYFALSEGPGVPRVPKAQQNSIIERAKAEGVIDGYRVRGLGYEVVGGHIVLSRVHFCNPESAGPCWETRPLIEIEYLRPAEAQAISRIASAQMPNARILSFEVTNLGG